MSSHTSAGPRSFTRPLYSFMGDWVMYKDIWTGKIPFQPGLLLFR